MAMVRAIPAKKEFAWSYSRVKNYESCGFRYQQVDLLRNFEDTGPALAEGKRVHDTYKERLLHGTPLPDDAPSHYEKWAQRVLAGPGKLFVEQKLAINKDFQTCDWRSNSAWLRVVIDVARIDDIVGLALDWKTGKVLEDSIQLAITAQVMFSQWPQLQAVRSEYIWLRDDCNSYEVFYRADMAALWTAVLPRVEALKEATRTNVFLPKPGYYCERYCPVLCCPHHGKRP